MLQAKLEAKSEAMLPAKLQSKLEAKLKTKLEAKPKAKFDEKNRWNIEKYLKTFGCLKIEDWNLQSILL